MSKKSIRICVALNIARGVILLVYTVNLLGKYYKVYATNPVRYAKTDGFKVKRLHGTNARKLHLLVWKINLIYPPRSSCFYMKQCL